ncbi:tRNA (cytidine(34)-2'-O)-methyltransferase [Magnetospira sp. QH-2]|uniref:tRNA (cytidine(34)-2'-O)-methyltransferase n=1 Tax=Magnetospira sp. (strain QH-2) TaxID=1288970 RepID=UPI0003E81440|nr:tRNA (cytidine(34)-2'-O)-methyltransferase [Magnetospira sp. QH-2]CCQ72648.1 tRNA/rRNA methyltransferase [Magnetospira sp. QH-2]
MRLVLFEPDIPQNAGTLFRLGACLGLPVDIIEPCGFILSDKHLRRAGMDYTDLVQITRHNSWADFEAQRTGRLILLTTRGDRSHVDFHFESDDCVMVGRESAGVPEAVHAAADARLRVPMMPDARSLNVAVTAALVIGEALRQTDGFPRL